MNDKISDIPESLIDALKAGQVVPFIGAGVSRAVEKKEKDDAKSYNPLFPSWKEFLDYAVEKLKLRQELDEAADIAQLLALKRPMYLEAAHRASKALGDAQWLQMLIEKLDLKKGDADENSLKLSKLVWELGSNLIITTNVDRVLQWTCPNPSEFRFLDMEKYELGELQKEKEVKYPTVLYLHGRIHNKKNVVFTPEQYENFYEDGNNQAKLQTLLNTLTKFTTLFIGFSLDDEYFLKQLNQINEIYEGGANSFYILLPESEKNNPNIPKYVEKIIYKHHGQPLIDLLERMKRIAQGDDNPPEQPASTAGIISTTISSSEKLSVAEEKYFNVPFASKGDAFVGREGLRERIWETLNKREHTTTIGRAVSIRGIGGLGKTQLAVEYAHKFRDSYKNGVFWLTADKDLNNQLIEIGKDLKWISPSDTNFDNAEVLRNRFRQLSDCLIIFDNVDDRRAIENYLPVKDTDPHILITSRERQPGFYEIELDLLNRDEARNLLLRVAGREPQTVTGKSALKEILKELDDLPLAVEMVGGYLRQNPIVSFVEYQRFLAEAPLEELEKEFPEDNFTRHDKSIIRTLRISEKLLDEKPAMREVLDILAWSGKSSMGTDLLRKLVATSEFNLKNVLSYAVNLRLIKKEENLERYTIHRLLANVRRVENPLENRNDWHKQIAKRMEEWFRGKHEESKIFSDAEIELDHLKEWQTSTLQYLPSEAVWLTVLKANHLMVRGNYQEAEKTVKRAFELYKTEKLVDPLLLANLYNALGQACNNLNHYSEASRFLEEGLDFYDKKLVVDKKLRAELLTHLGTAYGDLKRHEEALALHQEALEIRREEYKEKHPCVASSLNNIGYMHDKLNNHQAALKFKQQSLDMWRELFGEKHFEIATALNSLGLTHSYLGEHQKALKYKKAALEMRKELFGEKHPYIANSLSNIGSSYLQLGKKKEGFKYKEQSQEMRQELFGWSDVYNTLKPCRLLMELYIENGCDKEAELLAAKYAPYIPQDYPYKDLFDEYNTRYWKRKGPRGTRRGGGQTVMNEK